MKKLRLLHCSVLLCAFTLAQDAVIKPNDALILEHIPPVPASIAEQADRYTQYRTAEMFDWRPARREMLIGTRFGETQQVHSVAMPGGARTQLTFFSDRVEEASYHPHVGDYFLFRKDVGGGEWYQIFRFDGVSADVTMLTDGTSRNEQFRWSNRGDRIAYGSTRRNRADLDFYVMDPTDKRTDN
jgi:Tol biopolymer transport system component